MWSGPRNISTALMRSWEARGDTFVCDEPLYPHYLRVTGIDHPGREAIIRQGETDWNVVIRRLTGPIPKGKSIFYQKHMAHHLLPSVDRAWLRMISHGILIRDPLDMLVSLSRVVENPTIGDTGLPQQCDLVRYLVEDLGAKPPIVDARDVLEQPETMLRKICDAFNVPYTPRMLAWDAGPRDTDGIWAEFWYEKVRSSTGFHRYSPPAEPLPPRMNDLYGECVPYYELLYRHRLTPDDAPDV